MDSGVCTQEHSVKSSLVLAAKKSVTYPGDLQDTSAKPPLYHKQPPALPPKPFPRIPNHSTGQWFSLYCTIVVCFCPAAPDQLRVTDCRASVDDNRASSPCWDGGGEMDKKESRFYNIMPVFKHLRANLAQNGSDGQFGD